MKNRQNAQTKAITADFNKDRWKYWLMGSAVLFGGVLAVSSAFAESHEDITISHGYTNFGELRYPAGFTHLDYVNVDAPKGGEIAMWSRGAFDNFNPYTRKGISGAMATAGHENILAGTADDIYGSYCYLCETLEYPESRDWVIFNLRQDVTFADGTGMTAHDLKFSIDLALEQGITEYRNVVNQFIASVEVLDDYRIRFNFTEDAPRRDAISFAGGTNAWSKAWFEANNVRLDETAETPFMGTGAYMMDSFDYGRQVIVKRNPNFWGADHPLNVGQNNFDSIRVEYFADSSAAFEGFKSGAYTFRNENSSKQWATGYDFPAIDNGWVVAEEIPNGNLGRAQSFIFNLRDEKWQDPRVREAVRLMFNFEWSNESLFFGLYERVNSFWENSELEATGAPSEAELALLQPLVDDGLLDASILSDEAILSPTSNAARALDRSNLRRASELLDEAGWIAGENGIRSKDGETLTAVFLEHSPAFDRIVNPIVENLSRLGVDAKLERVDTAQYVERRRSGDYDLVNHSFGMGFEPGKSLEAWFGSESALESSRNLMGLQNEAVDRLLETIVDAVELDDLTTAVHALDRVLRAEGFWVPQWFKDVHTVAYYDIFDYPESLPPFALGETSFWWYDAEAAARLQAAGAFQ